MKSKGAFQKSEPAVLKFWAVLTLQKHSTSLSTMFVYIRVPPNNPINARAPSLGPRLSLFSEVSYSFCSHRQQQQQQNSQLISNLATVSCPLGS